MYKFARKVMLFKIEAVYGTDPVPTGPLNAILAYNGEITPMEATYVERKPMRPFLGPQSKLVDGKSMGLVFDVHAAGSGAAATAVPYGPILRACGLAETITPVTGPVEYEPVSSAEESGTAYFYMAGALHKGQGMRGNVEFMIDALDVPRFHVTMTGLFQDIAAGAFPAPDFSAFQTPLVASKAATPTFTLHGYAGKLASLSLNLGNEVRYRNLIGAESVDNTDRAASGRISIESPDLAAKNYFTAAKDGIEAALQVIHGSVAGNIVQIDAPKVQVTNPRYADRDGITFLDMDLNVAPDAGDDEIKITTK
jgi:hypothetical protein